MFANIPDNLAPSMSLSSSFKRLFRRHALEQLKMAVQKENLPAITQLAKIVSIDSLKALIKAANANQQIYSALKQPDLITHWQQQLTRLRVPSLDFSYQPNPRQHPFDQVFGIMTFRLALLERDKGKEPFSEAVLNYLIRSANAGHFQSQRMLAEFVIDNLAKNEPNTSSAFVLELAQQTAKVFKTPGCVVAADLCLEFAAFCSKKSDEKQAKSSVERTLTYLYLAKALVNDSSLEMHNAYYGYKLTEAFAKSKVSFFWNDFKDWDSLIAQFIQYYNIQPETTTYCNSLACGLQEQISSEDKHHPAPRVVRF